MKILIKKMFIILGLATLIGNSIVLYVTFLAAYFNGFTIRVFVNNYSEAHFEFILFPVGIVSGIYALRQLITGRVRFTKHSIQLVENEKTL